MEESLYLDRLKGPLLSVPVRGTEKAEKIWEPHLQPTFSPVWPWACATLSIPTHLGMTSHVWNESSKEGFFINCDCFYFHMKISKENIIFPPWIFFFIWWLKIFTRMCFTSNLPAEQEAASLSTPFWNEADEQARFLIIRSYPMVHIITNPIWQMKNLGSGRLSN